MFFLQATWWETNTADVPDAGDVGQVVVPGDVLWSSAADAGGVGDDDGDSRLP